MVLCVFENRCHNSPGRLSFARDELLEMFHSLWGEILFTGFQANARWHMLDDEEFASVC